MSRKHNITSKREDADPSEAIVSKAAENPGNMPARHKQNAMNGVDRHEMIAMAAYYRAEKRGFNNGDATQDWLEAETEIDGMI